MTLLAKLIAAVIVGAEFALCAENIIHGQILYNMENVSAALRLGILGVAFVIFAAFVLLKSGGEEA